MEEDPTKQTIIAEFQSKVIQAQAEGNETESTSKKKAQGESTNEGGNMNENRKNSVVLTNQDDKAKVDPQSKNAVMDTIETEPIGMNNKPSVSDEPINVPNSKKAATEKSSSTTKLSGDTSQSDNKLDATSEVSQEKSNLQGVVKESFSNKVTSTEKSSSNSEHRSGLSTPSQRSKQVSELEPISPTPLPETPSSGATSSVGTSSKSNLCKYPYAQLCYNFCCRYDRKTLYKVSGFNIFYNKPIKLLRIDAKLAPIYYMFIVCQFFLQ